MMVTPALVWTARPTRDPRTGKPGVILVPVVRAVRAVRP